MSTPTSSGDPHGPEFEVVKRGFAELPLSDAYQRSALANLARWLAGSEFAGYRGQLLRLIEQRQWGLLLDSFYRVLPFGTGGRRGPVGIGTNRFNPFTLECSVQGHVDFLRAQFPGEALTVVLAYDVRTFHDLRRRYDPSAITPLSKITSQRFAMLAAQVYAANGVHVFMLPTDSSRYISTPELSFTIRKLRASAGLNVSASHNHPDDNGGKFYNRFGAQEVPPDDERMSTFVERVESATSLPFETARAKGLVTWIPPEIHDAYVALNLAQSLRSDARDARIVFTPLHGTGGTTVGEVLRKAGFRVDDVAAQSTTDGAFPAVPFRAPNPEVEESMEMGVALARAVGADVVMACDPDADRIGICSRTRDGGYRFFVGNEIASLVTYIKLELLKERGALPKSPLVIKTEVTTELLRPITAHFGGRLIGDLLVGFKYHADVLARIEATGTWNGVPARLADFVIAVEESHGVLATTEIRDKDAAGAALLLAEQASLEKRRGRTLVDTLSDIYRMFGYYGNLVTSIVMSGAEGLSQIQRIQEGLRNRPPTSVGGSAVTEVVDHWSEVGVHGAFQSETDKGSRNVLVFRLANGARVSLRPSGTEPKSKTYVEVPTAPLGLGADDAALARQRTEADAAARRIADDFTRQMLAVVGVVLPDYALRISGLVALDNRVDFAKNFVPEFERRAESVLLGTSTAADASKWIDERLVGYGADGRRLVADAMRGYLESERLVTAKADPASRRTRVPLLDRMESLFFAAPASSGPSKT